MFSYWEKKHFFSYDLIVIGSGFVGLSSAIHFRQKNPGANILVVDRGVFPTGASTKNAGFACFGSLSELVEDLGQMSPDEALALVERRYSGLNQIRKRFGDEKLGYSPSGGYEILDRDELPVLDHLESINEWLRSIFQTDVFSVERNPGELGFSPQIDTIVRNKFEGELDPGKYIMALWRLASSEGIRILTGVNVSGLDRDQGVVYAHDTCKGEEMEFRANQLAVCTNAFTKALWSESELRPGRGLVQISKPLGFTIPWKGGFHRDRGYVYFRQLDGRLLIGGGRNKDFESEESLDFEVNPGIRTYLRKLASELIFPEKKIEWEMEWTGIMAFGPNKSPIIQQIGERTFAAVRLGGMGVAIGWQVGSELSQLLSGE